MPELPDVEVFRRCLEATALHQAIARVDVRDRGVLGVSPRALRGGLAGRAFTGTRRHGKHLFVATDGGPWLVLHFGMTGFLEYSRTADGASPYARVVFGFANGARLAFDDVRKLGRVSLTDDVDAFVARRRLGPDALALDAGAYRRALARRRGGVKAALMDQTCLAGIGNLYADEILFQAGIHPRRDVATLGERRRDRLYRAIRGVLRTAIRQGVDADRFPRSYLLPRRRAGGRCPRCGGPLRTTQAAGRTGYFCARHQR